MLYNPGRKFTADHSEISARSIYFRIYQLLSLLCKKKKKFDIMVKHYDERLMH